MQVALSVGEDSPKVVANQCPSFMERNVFVDLFASD